MVNKKIKLIFLGSIILFLIIIGLFLLIKNNYGLNTSNTVNFSSKFEPEFLTTQEKNKFTIDPNTKVQAVFRNNAGEVTVYKIINNDSDVVNPKDVGSVR